MSIKTWQERWETRGVYKDAAMQAEIAELRAALAERDAEIEDAKTLLLLAQERFMAAEEKLAAQRKVLEMALEALKNAPVFGPRSKQHKDAITAIQGVLK